MIGLGFLVRLLNFFGSVILIAVLVVLCLAVLFAFWRILAYGFRFFFKYSRQEMVDDIRWLFSEPGQFLKQLFTGKRN